MKERTNIQIEKKTVLRLRTLRITRLDTYDEIINRLIDEKLEHEKRGGSQE